MGNKFRNVNRKNQASLTNLLEQRRRTKLISHYASAIRGSSGQKTSNYQRRLKGESFESINEVFVIVHNDSNTPFSKNTFPAKHDKFVIADNLLFTCHLEDELNWLAFSVLKNVDKVNSFLKLKSEYQKSILIGKYNEASIIIDDIFENFGWSLWLINEKLLLAECKDGLKANRQALNDISDCCGNYEKILANFFSYRAESGNSWGNYCNECERFINKHSDKDSIRCIVSHMNFAINFPNFNKFNQLDAIAYILSRYPIIDRYLGLIKVLQIIIANRMDVSSKISNLVSELGNSIDDISLYLLSIFCTKNGLSKKHELLADLMKISDSYTCGEYIHSSERSFQCLLEYPDVFEFYELYLKSIICGKLRFTNPYPKGSVSNKIIEHMYNVFLRNDKMTDSINLLSKMAYTLDSMPISQHIVSFVTDSLCSPDSDYRRRMAYLNDSAITPRVSLIFEYSDIGLYFLDHYESFLPNSLTLKHFKTFLDKDDWHTDACLNIPEIRRQKYAAYYLLKNNKYDEAKDIFEVMLGSDDIPQFYIKDIVHNLILCYVETREFNQCVKLFLKIFYHDKNILCLGDWHYIAKKIDITVGNIGIKAPILASIFQQEKITSKDTIKLHELLEDYLDSISITKPSEIEIDMMSEDQYNHFVYLLKNVCTQDVLEHSFVFKSTNDLENERVEICRKLQKLDKINSDVYSVEIKNIAQIQTTRESVHRIDQCKVHIGVAGILSLLDKDVEEMYNRCVNFRGLDESLRQHPKLDSDSDSDSDSEIEMQDFLFAVDLSLRLFEEIFSKIKNLFLTSSEYGLDCYLSVRIRHGALDGQIRSVFSKCNLITLKSTNEDSYVENNYWNCKIFGNNLRDRCLANKYWQEFSKKIDYTIEYLRNEIIQIRSERHSFGIFNYNYREESISFIWARCLSSASNYDKFLSSIIAILMGTTNANLEDVKKYILGVLKKDFFETLDVLEQNIASINTDADMREFKDVINRSKTYLETSLREIAEWFNIADKPNFANFGIKQLIAAVVAIMGKCNPDIVFDTQINECKDAVFVGSTFVNLIDVFFIVFDNIAKHSCCTTNNKVRIDLSVSDNNVIIEVINELGDNCDIVEIEEKLRSIKERTDTRGLISSEGGTGFVKIKKILKYDLPYRDNDVKFAIDVSNRLFRTSLMLSKEILHENPDN